MKRAFFTIVRKRYGAWPISRGLGIQRDLRDVLTLVVVEAIDVVHDARLVGLDCGDLQPQRLGSLEGGIGMLQPFRSNTGGLPRARAQLPFKNDHKRKHKKKTKNENNNNKNKNNSISLEVQFRIRFRLYQQKVAAGCPAGRTMRRFCRFRLLEKSLECSTCFFISPVCLYFPLSCRL